MRNNQNLNFDQSRGFEDMEAASRQFAQTDEQHMPVQPVQNSIPTVPVQPMQPGNQFFVRMPAGFTPPHGNPRKQGHARARQVRRRPPYSGTRRPVMTNGYMFSFGESSTPPQTAMPMQSQMAMPMQPQIPMQSQMGMPVQPQIPVQSQMGMPVQPQIPVQSQMGMLMQPKMPMQSQMPQWTQMPQTVQGPVITPIRSDRESDSAIKGKNAPPPTRGKLIRDSIMVAGMIVLLTLSSMVMLSSGVKRAQKSTEQKSFFEDLDSDLLNFKSDSLGSIFSIPKVYVLPWGEQPAPVPNPNGFAVSTDENGVKIHTYNDDTISVKYWTERSHDSNVHFAEAKIAHPTQLRTAYAGGEFGSSQKYMPQVIAQQVNAVIAINGDYCGYRTGGIIVRQNNLYRNTARGWDTLLIDSDGNFHIMEDKDIHASGIMEEYDIVNSLAFGPSLVIDGEVKMLNINSGCGALWNEEKLSPRTGIGQIGELHYLFCCVEGRSDTSKGVTTSQFARIMRDKGCVQAYNLDGGQSTTMILDGNAMNKPLWGSQRVVTDIIYCATAIPNEEGVNANG